MLYEVLKRGGRQGFALHQGRGYTLGLNKDAIRPCPMM